MIIIGYSLVMNALNVNIYIIQQHASGVKHEKIYINVSNVLIVNDVHIACDVYDYVIKNVWVLISNTLKKIMKKKSIY